MLPLSESRSLSGALKFCITPLAASALGFVEVSVKLMSSQVLKISFKKVVDCVF